MKRIITSVLLSVLIGLSAIAQVPVSGLVGYWPFNGNANDESGNGKNGIITNATPTTDRFGNANSAYSFLNGQKIVVSSFNVNFTEITVSCWYKTNSAWDRVFQHNWDVATGTFVITPSNPYTSAQFRNSVGGQPLVAATGLGTCDNLWHNIVIAYSSTDLKEYLYVDGIIKSTTTVTSSLKTGIADLIFGGTMNTGNQISIDDSRIYNRVLTASEIALIYNEGLCKSSISVTDTLKINVSLAGFNPISYKNSIKIYPNPTHDELTIDCGANYNTLNTYKVKITNNLGQSVYESLVTKQISTVNLNSWTGKGIYMIQLIDSNSNIIDNKKIVLQ